jgi:ABC-type branched-subunit amino acid transport system substrate-binding protein
MKTRTRFTRLLGAVAALTLVAAACGSDDDTSSDATDAPAATEPSATDPTSTEPSDTEPDATAPDSTEPAEPGEPLKIMAFGTYESQTLNLDQARAGVEAHVEVLNADGGAAGHPIEVIVCNDNFDPNEAASCARQAVDEGVVAIVGPASGYASTALPILEEAKIPYLNGSGAGGVIELTSPVSFPLHGGSQAQLMGAGRALVEEGSTNVAIVVADADQAREAATNIQVAIADAGGNADAPMTNAPLGAPDYSAVAAAALDGDPDGIVIAHVPADAPKIIQALRQAGYEGLIATSTGILTQVGVDAIGEAAEGVIVLDRGQLATDDSIPEVADYLAGMAEYEPDALIDAASLNGWAAVTFFTELVARTDAASGGAEITGAALIETLGSLTEPIQTGAFDDYSGPTDPPVVADFPQVANFKANVARVDGGVIASYKGFIDLAAT